MKLYEFFAIINDYEALINFLIQRRVIRDAIICRNCGSELKVNRRTLLLRCSYSWYESARHTKRRRKHCNFEISAFHGTWFEKMHLDIQTSCRIISTFLYSEPPHQSKMEMEYDLGPNTAVDWISFCREVSR